MCRLGSRTEESCTKGRRAPLPAHASLGTPDCQPTRPHQTVAFSQPSTYQQVSQSTQNIGDRGNTAAARSKTETCVGKHLCGERAVGKMRMDRASVYMDSAMDWGLAIPLICLARPSCPPAAATVLSPGDAGSRGSCTATHVLDC